VIDVAVWPPTHSYPDGHAAGEEHGPFASGMQRGRSNATLQIVPAAQSSVVRQALPAWPGAPRTQDPPWHVPVPQQSASEAQPFAQRPPWQVASQTQSVLAAHVSTQNPSAPH
jgi:hypothetical protein